MWQIERSPRGIKNLNVVHVMMEATRMWEMFQISTRNKLRSVEVQTSECQELRTRKTGWDRTSLMLPRMWGGVGKSKFLGVCEVRESVHEVRNDSFVRAGHC